MTGEHYQNPPAERVLLLYFYGPSQLFIYAGGNKAAGQDDTKRGINDKPEREGYEE